MIILIARQDPLGMPEVNERYREKGQKSNAYGHAHEGLLRLDNLSFGTHLVDR